MIYEGLNSCFGLWGCASGSALTAAMIAFVACLLLDRDGVFWRMWPVDRSRQGR